MKKYIIVGFLLICLTITYSVNAKEYSFIEALNEYNLNKDTLQLPKPEEDGRIQTLNKKGATSPELDIATRGFIDFAKNKKVLEIGGAYGLVMKEVLTKYSNTIYHLNDLDTRHLLIAANQLENINLPKVTLNKVKFVSYDISAPLTSTEQYDAILVARVLHFLAPIPLEAAIKNLYTLLKPGGRVYLIAITPYVKRYENFIPEYEKRVLAKTPYPGFVQSLKDWVNLESITPSQLQAISPEPFMFLDDKILEKLFTNNGFKILECKITGLEYESKAWSLDGRENVMIIAEKPTK